MGELNKLGLGLSVPALAHLKLGARCSTSGVGVIETKIGGGGSRTENSCSRAPGRFEKWRLSRPPAGFEDFGHHGLKEADRAQMTLDRRGATGVLEEAVPVSRARMAGPEVLAAKAAGASGAFIMEIVVLHTRLRRSGCGPQWATRAHLPSRPNVVVN